MIVSDMMQISLSANLPDRELRSKREAVRVNPLRPACHAVSLKFRHWQAGFLVIARIRRIEVACLSGQVLFSQC
jgi:hypothetical protein